MENARIVIAIALSFAVFLLWDFFFVPKETSKAPTSVSAVPETKIADKAEEPIKKASETKSTPEGAIEASPARQIAVDTPLYQAVFSEQGAQLSSFTLKKYRKTVDSASPPQELIDATVVGQTLGVYLNGTEGKEGLNERYNAEVDSPNIALDSGTKQVVFRRRSSSGIVIEKQFSFTADSYMIALRVGLQNQSEQALSDTLVLALKKSMPEKSSSYGFEGPSGYIGGKLKEIKIEDVAKEGQLDGPVEWIGVQDRYFLEAIVPLEIAAAKVQMSYDKRGYVENRLLQAIESLEPGKESQRDYKLYLGPKSLQELKRVDHNLDQAVNFGFFDIIAKPLLWFMNHIYGVIPNYGIAIILLTIVIKIVLWPLGNKSYRSMSEMKKIQPLMVEIREKYKDDKQRMNQEIMSLYRLYKVNPMGGCLPMLLQIPVFFALYSMLYTTIELRHAPFMGWINDLSAPDRLFHFGFSIPFMEPPYGIPVLTIIMGATMFIQQKMSPPAGDPTQAKMMMMMPIVFTVIFINFSAGLVLYWLVNNVISIAQQYYITQKA